MHIIKQREKPHRVQYFVVHMSDLESSDDEESFPKATTTIVLPPDHSSSFSCCRTASTDHDTDSIHATDDWGVLGPSWRKSGADRGAPLIDIGTSTGPQPSIHSSAYFTDYLSFNGAGVSSCFTNTTNLPSFLQDSRISLPMLAILILIFITCYFWISIVHFTFYFSKGHLPCFLCTYILIIVDFILSHFILFLYLIYFHLFLHQGLRWSGPVLARTIRSLDKGNFITLISPIKKIRKY